jgi:hypothetical protein
MRSRCLGVVLVAALAGCGPSAGGGSGGGGAVPLERLGDEYAAAFCRKVFACCDAAERQATTLGTGDEAACRVAFGATIADDIADVQASVAAGITTYDGQKARRCFDALVGLPCAEWGGDDAPERIPDCTQMLRGTIAPGGACLGGRECADGACSSDGTCVANAGAGESCLGRGCRGALYCDTDASGALTTCVAYQPNGAPCSFDGECRSNTCGSATPRVCTPPTMCDGV